MGLLKKVKKAVKKVRKSAETAIKAPVRVGGAVVRGDFSGAVKGVGQYAGSMASLNPHATVLSGRDAQNIMRNKMVNAVTLNTGNEVANTSKGFGDLQARGEAPKRFWQSASALGAKAGTAVAVGAYAPGALTAKNAHTAAFAGAALKKGNVKGAVSALSGIDGVKGPEFLNDIKNNEYANKFKDYKNTVKGYMPKNSESAQGAQNFDQQNDGFIPASNSAQSKSSIATPLLIGGALAMTGIGLPIAVAGGAAALLLNKKDEQNG